MSQVVNNKILFVIDPFPLVNDPAEWDQLEPDKAGMLYAREHRWDEAVAAFDRALDQKPLMREALIHRGLTRLKKFVFRELGGLLNYGMEAVLSVKDLELVPAEEQQKICSDLTRAGFVDFSDLYVRKLVPVTVLNFYLKRMDTGAGRNPVRNQ